jgi:hypothetical protein
VPDNLITEIRNDVQVLQAVIKADVPPTDIVINGVWRWFLDVELYLPLPVMELTTAEQKTFATTILEEMDTHFAKLETRWDHLTNEEKHHLNQTDDSTIVNNLWRELAGVYAALINKSVTILDPEDKEAAEATAVEMLMHASGMDEEEIRHRVRHDPTMRLMLRRSGIDPDHIR